ncbi:hypothetical protein CDAR_555371 [Caerostris darwini]|uniref:Uncharacterized protein n=1 Tax=Caerostris darwini TaxID=1538125 RepID=A0AAV4T8A2_9ARAC|nr:hypothetical protein CDAR_555371 [Caerostris darwini]
MPYRPSRRLITTISLLGFGIVPTKIPILCPQNKSHSVPNVLMVNTGDSADSDYYKNGDVAIETTIISGRLIWEDRRRSAIC